MNDHVEKGNSTPEPTKAAQSEILLEIWKKVVDVQMHFNDLCLRLRSMAMSILGVLVGASALALRFGGNITVCSFSMHISAVFLILSTVIWSAFYFMDRYWYHELLKGSVHHGLAVEKMYEEAYPEIRLAHAIKDQSHQSLNMNAATKLTRFYLVILGIQILGLIFMLTGSLGMNN